MALSARAEPGTGDADHFLAHNDLRLDLLVGEAGGGKIQPAEEAAASGNDPAFFKVFSGIYYMPGIADDKHGIMQVTYELFYYGYCSPDAVCFYIIYL